MLLLQGRTVAMEGLRTGDAVGEVGIWGRANCLLRAQHPAEPAGPAAEGLRPPMVWGGGEAGAAGAAAGGRPRPPKSHRDENRTFALKHDSLVIARTIVAYILRTLPRY